jgi:peptide/nickel transport system substrate-binding protein
MTCSGGSGITNLRSRALAIAVAVALAACTAAASTGGSGGRTNAWTQPHVLRYATGDDVSTLNPHLSQQLSLSYIASLTMAYLVKWDEHNDPYAELATAVPTMKNGGVSRDGLTITYHLRHGVTWSDGAPFDADDVVFSTGVVLDPANDEAARTGWDQIVRTDEPDKYTVVYHLRKPYSPFVETFFSTAAGNPCILPKHLLARYPNINHVAYNALPVGIGPFKYLRWDRGHDVIMVPNPRYFRGLPKLDEVDFKIVSDRGAIVAALEENRLDMWFPASGTYYDRIKSLQAFDVLEAPGYDFDHLDFNVTRPAVSDPVVRRALRLAIDRAALVKNVDSGMGTIQESTTPATSPYNVAIPAVPFDIARANALLDSDGWARGAGGIRAKNGVRLALDVATVTSVVNDAKIELIRASWRQIGVSLNVRHYSAAVAYAPVQRGGIIGGNSYDVTMFAWQNGAIGDYSGLYSCNSIPPDGQNNLRWCNRKAQAAMMALFSHFDQAQQNADVAILEHELVNDVPTIVLDMRAPVYVMNKDLKDFRPNSVTAFDNMMDVDI